MRRKVLQFHLLRYRHGAGSLAVPPLPAHDEFAKRIRRYRDPLPWIGRELNCRLGTSGCVPKAWQKPRTRRCAGALPKELSSVACAHARKCNRECRCGCRPSKLPCPDRIVTVFESQGLVLPEWRNAHPDSLTIAVGA
jgi:hypothetical protein